MDPLTDEQKAKIKSAPDGQRFSLGGRVYAKQSNQLVAVDAHQTPTPSTVGPLSEQVKSQMGEGIVSKIAQAGETLKAPLDWAKDKATAALQSREAPQVAGAVLGGAAGGPIGAGLGAGIGEEAQQLREMIGGERATADVPRIATSAAGQAAMEGVGVPLIGAAARGLKAAGTKALEAVLPRSIYEARLVQAYRAAKPFWERVTAAFTKPTTEQGPQTLAKTLTERGIAGTEVGIGVKAARAQRSLWEHMIKPALQSSKTKVNMPAFLDEVGANITRDTPELLRRQELLGQLEKLKDTYAGTGKVSLEQLQDFKHGWADFVSKKSYLGLPIGAKGEVRAEAARLAREKIYNELGPEVRQAYFDHGNLREVMKHAQVAMTSRIRGGSGVTIGALKNLAVTPVATVGGQVLYKGGNALELVGAPGARVVRDVVPGMFAPDPPEKPKKDPAFDAATH